jgi:hypothetical protein
MKPLLILGAVAMATACLSPGEPVDQLLLSISLSTSHVQADSGVVVRLEARNPYQRTIHLTTTGGCVLSYYVIAPNDTTLTRDEPCDLVERELDVGPGEAIVRELTWRPGVVSEGSPLTLTRWPAGRYQIVGVLRGRDLHMVRETEPVGFDLVCHDTSWPEC